jgi:hypothetical protein
MARSRGLGDVYKRQAQTLGYSSRGDAHKAVMKELNLLAKECLEEAAQVRDLELQRLDELYLAAWKAITEGSESAIDRALRVSESRRKMMGLDAAQKVDVNGIAELHFDREDENL